METHNQTITLCNSTHTVCLSVDSKGCIKAWQGRGLRRDNPNLFVIHKPLLCNLDNRFLFRSDSLNFRVNHSSGSFSLSFQVVHLQERATPKLKENTLHKILGKLLFNFFSLEKLISFGKQEKVEEMKPILRFFLAGFLLLILQTRLCYGIKWM